MTAIGSVQKPQTPTLTVAARSEMAPKAAPAKDAPMLQTLDRAEAAHAASSCLKQLAFVETPLVALAAVAGRKAVMGKADLKISGGKAWQDMTGVGKAWRTEAQLMPKTKGALIVAGAAAAGVGVGHLIRKASGDTHALPIPAILGVVGGVTAFVVLKGKAGNAAFNAAVKGCAAKGIRFVTAPF